MLFSFKDLKKVQNQLKDNNSCRYFLKGKQHRPEAISTWKFRLETQV